MMTQSIKFSTTALQLIQTPISFDMHSCHLGSQSDLRCFELELDLHNLLWYSADVPF